MSPADLDAFCRRTIETLQQTPIRATCTDAPAQSGREYVTCLVQLDSFEGKRLRAWYSVPKDREPGGKVPAVLAVPGYGGDKPIPTHLAVNGCAVLTLYPRGQGESCQEWTLEHSTKLTYRVTDKQRFYYRGAYMDCVRGLDFLASRPEAHQGVLDTLPTLTRCTSPRRSSAPRWSTWECVTRYAPPPRVTAQG